MHRRSLWTFALLLCAFPLPAQNPPAPSAPKPIVRVEVNLVQVDAVVTDHRGRQVTNLKADDFQVLEDNKPRPVLGVNYVRNASMQPANSPEPKTTIAILVDDLHMSFESVAFLRKSLTKFVDTQLHPGDQVAILRASSGSGAWDEFTSNRRVLQEEVGLIHWVPALWGSPFFSYQKPPVYLAASSRIRPSAAEDWDAETTLSVFDGGTLGALRFILQGMSAIPGRKAVILFSDQFPVFTSEGFGATVVTAFRSLTDLANRAGVVLYSADPSGVSLFAPSRPILRYTQAEPELMGESNDSRMSQFLNYSADNGAGPFSGPMMFGNQPVSIYRSSLYGLDVLANQTGGMFLGESNDLNRQIAKVQSDLDSYYLIGFSPAPDSPSRQGAPFHTIRIIAKRRDLQVRSRRGFVGLPDSLPGPEPEPAGTRQLIHAVFTPFVISQVPVVLNTMYTYAGKSADVQNFVYIEPHRLHLAQQPDGSHTGTLELAVFAFRPNGETAAHIAARTAVSLNAAQYAVALQKGMVYGFQLNLPPGVTYQVRAAVLDRGSGQLGSANQVLVVPDREKGQVALSSLELTPIDKANPQAGGQLSRGFLTHRFRPDAVLGYRCAVFNARTDPASQQAALVAQPLIYRDDKLVYTGPATNIAAAPGANGSTPVSGAVKLDHAFPPGDYALVLQVTDTLQPNKKTRTRSVWAGFTVAPQD
jgi:VWFA-related protein